MEYPLCNNMLIFFMFDFLCQVPAWLHLMAAHAWPMLRPSDADVTVVPFAKVSTRLDAALQEYEPPMSILYCMTSEFAYPELHCFPRRPPQVRFGWRVGVSNAGRRAAACRAPRQSSYRGCLARVDFYYTSWAPGFSWASNHCIGDHQGAGGTYTGR